MSSVFKYIKSFYVKDFNSYYFLLILLLLGIVIYLNYWHGLEKNFAGGGKSKLSHFAGYYLMYFIPFFTAFFLQLFFLKDCSYFQNKWFWIIVLLAPAFFSFRVNFNFQDILLKKIWTGDELKYWLRCISWIVRVVVLMIPVFIIWFIKDKGNQPFYGINALGNAKPYFIMLLLMVPLIALASTQKDFLHTYPKVKFLYSLSFANEKWRYVLHELCYGFDFLSIEFFFRGFLILSLVKTCGPHSIIPVACFYCTIHLGKPMGEAVSSFWGGLLLGIVSYNTGSVWGGVIVHLGIAWMMELGGFLGALF